MPKYDYNIEKEFGIITSKYIKELKTKKLSKEDKKIADKLVNNYLVFKKRQKLVLENKISEINRQMKVAKEFLNVS